jgi:hypothetical protein
MGFINFEYAAKQVTFSKFWSKALNANPPKQGNFRETFGLFHGN